MHLPLEFRAESRLAVPNVLSVAVDGTDLQALAFFRPTGLFTCTISTGQPTLSAPSEVRLTLVALYNIDIARHPLEKRRRTYRVLCFVPQLSFSPGSDRF